MGVGCRHEWGLMGGMFLRGVGVGNPKQKGACAQRHEVFVSFNTVTPTLALPPQGGGNYLWEPRSRGDAAVRAPQTFDRGEGAAPTNTPSPLMGEGGGEGEQRPQALADDGSTPTLALMELLAARLSPQAGKSTVIPPQGGGDSCLVSEVVKRSFEQSHVAKQVALTPPGNTPSPLRGEGGGGGEQCPVAMNDAWQCAKRGIAPRRGSYNSNLSFRHLPESIASNRPKPSPTSAIDKTKRI
jgi:hypothetical protein